MADVIYWIHNIEMVCRPNGRRTIQKYQPVCIGLVSDQRSKEWY